MMNDTAGISSDKLTAHIVADATPLPRHKHPVLRFSQRRQLCQQLNRCSRRDSNSYIRVVVFHALR